jgi:hypothetical protein
VQRRLRSPTVLELDHVVYATADLDGAAEAWRQRYGLASVVGGRHERWGTENRIVPLGSGYLELLSVFDPAVASGDRFASSIAERAAEGGGWVTPVLRTDDLDGVAARLGLEVVEGSRRRPDGEVLRWRSVGVSDHRREPSWPFFIEWDVPPELHPSASRAGYGKPATGISKVDVSGDPAELEAWLGELPPELSIVDGSPAVLSVTVSTRDGDLRIE